MGPALAALVGVTFVHLGAQLGDPGGLVAGVTQVLLMPALGWVLAAGAAGRQNHRRRLVTLTYVALGCSWLGDTLPRFLADGFLVMLGCFLLAQIAYIAAFLPSWRASVAGRGRPLLVAYAVVLVRLVAACHERAGAFFVPVAVYGTVLTTMAVLATGLGWLAGIGGAVFLASDSLIALREFAGWELPAHGFWVMLTYVLGQTLLVLAVVRRVRVQPSSRVTLRTPGRNGAARPAKR